MTRRVYKQYMQSKIMLDGKLEVFPDGTIYKIKDGKREEAKVFSTSRRGNYRCISIWVNGKQKAYYVHRLVAEAFIPNPYNKKRVNHIDGDPTNNKVDNLRWFTPSESTMNAYRTGLINPAEWTVPCKVCGEPTLAKDEICSLCKKNLRHDAKEDSRRAQIRDLLGNVDLNLLTELERKAVLLRLEYLTYQEIATIMGCTKQCVEQRIHNAMKKSSCIPEHTKKSASDVIKINNRIVRKKLKIKKLNDEANMLFRK